MNILIKNILSLLRSKTRPSNEFIEDEAARERAKYYLDYIDKEMTFAGIVTTINLGILLFIGERLFSTSPNLICKLHISQILGVSIGLILVSTALLIWHRSDLAFYYGQISLSIFSPRFTNRPVRHWLKLIDNWRSWTIYFIAMGLLYAGVILLCITFFTSTLQCTSQINCIVSNQLWISAIVVIIVGLVVLAFNLYQRNKNPNNPLPLDEMYAQDMDNEET